MRLLRSAQHLLLFSCKVISDSFATPWTAACQSPLFMGFSRPEHWSVLPLPSPGDLPNPRMEPMSPALQGIPSHSATREAEHSVTPVLFLPKTYSLNPIKRKRQTETEDYSTR